MTGPERLRVSLILTVKNEAESIEDLLASIAAQHRAPDEVIVVDGGSSDHTVRILERYRDRLPLTVLEAPGTSISQGRNVALGAATGDVVAVTDGGVRLDPRWLEELLAPFERASATWPDVVAGFFRADPRSLFETALAATTLPDEAEIAPERFLPSSRSVAFRRSWFTAGVRYPEWLDYCEDLIFDLRLRRAGARFEFRPAAFVWFRPRSRPRAFWRQYYLYARGDGKAGLFARRHLVRYLTYVVLIPAVMARRDRRLGLLAAVGAAAYMRRPWQRLWRRRGELSPPRLVAALALAPALRLLGDLAKLSGYPVGLVWRWRRYGMRRTWTRILEDTASAAGGKVVSEAAAQELGGP